MKIKKIITKLWLYIKYPISFSMDFTKFINKNKYRKLGLEGFPPNYIYFNRFNEKSIVIDVGCGFEAELSVTLINKYNVTAFAVDPTLKHQSFIQQIEREYASKFNYLQYALSAENGETTFYEAENCESGSLLSAHKNLQTNKTTEYKVQLIDLPSLINLTGSKDIEYLKIDIEGAEYQLFNDKNLEALKNVKQLFIEFHHISVEGFSKKDTLNVVKKIESVGFKSFSYDGLNYLFFNN